GRDEHYFNSVHPKGIRKVGSSLAHRGLIGLVDGHEPRPLRYPTPIFADFRAYGPRVCQRILSTAINEIQNYLRALNVAEEVKTKAGAVMRALDQPGDVCHHERLPIPLDYAEDRFDRGEGIIGHFRPGSRYRAKQGRFPGIWQAHDANVGD